MPNAICLRCGEAKQAALDVCPRCGLDPRGNPESAIRSVYLSEERFESQIERTNYRRELDEIAYRIRHRQPFEFDGRELNRLRRQHHIVESVTASALVRVLIRFFLPGIIFLIILIGLLVALRSL